jgi:hypothetical protein
MSTAEIRIFAPWISTGLPGLVVNAGLEANSFLSKIEGGLTELSETNL